MGKYIFFAFVVIAIGPVLWNLIRAPLLHFANLAWVRFAICYDVFVGTSSWKDLFGDTSDFRGKRQFRAKRLIVDFLFSDQMRSFVREHEGEKHEHLVFLVNAEGRDHLIDLANRTSWIRLGSGLREKSIEDALYDFYKHDRGYDPLIYAKLAIWRANRLIDRHTPASAHPHQHTSH